MYSSWVGGIVNDVDLMMVPVDDHLVHRGDGVFEAIRFVGDLYFEIDAHLERLFRSMQMIGLKEPTTKTEMMHLAREVVQASGLSEGQIRIFVSRGPGDFSPNPYSTLRAQLYIVVLPDAPRNPKLYAEGARLVFSKIPIKPYPFAQIKSCNYLQNVMTKKEALDRNADFAVNLAENNEVAEGPTENVMILTAQNDLLAPLFDYTLRGTTLLRVMAIAESVKNELGLRSIGTARLKVADFLSAKEVMMIGTTLGVCPVTLVDGQKVQQGLVGPIAKRLDHEIRLAMGYRY